MVRPVNVLVIEVELGSIFKPLIPKNMQTYWLISNHITVELNSSGMHFSKEEQLIIHSLVSNNLGHSGHVQTTHCLYNKCKPLAALTQRVEESQ